MWSRRARLLPVEWLAVAVVIVALAARLWPALVLDLDGDEAYYTMWSAFLQPGYYDHPPAIALFISFGRFVVGEGVLGVRLLALLSGLATLAALHRTALLLAADRGTAALAVILYCLTLQAAIGFVATPDAPSTLFWTLAHWAATEALVGKRPNWWLAVGLFAGAGLASKYTNAWFGVGLVLFLVATPEGRTQLRSWQIWVGGLIALAVFSPVLWWNWQNEWRSFLFQGARLAEGKELSFGPLFVEYFASQAIAIGPVLAICTGGAVMVWAVGNASRRAALALPIITSAPILLYFAWHSLHARVQVNWTQPLVPVLAIAAALFLAHLQRRWLRHTLVTVHAALGALLIVVAVGQATLHPFEFGIADRTRMLRGWDELSARVRAIADDVGAKVIWTAASYSLTGELFFHGLVTGDPRPVRDASAHPRYDFIPQSERFPPHLPAILVLQVGIRDDAPAPPGAFSEAMLITVLERRDNSGSGDRYAVFSVTDSPAAAPPPR